MEKNSFIANEVTQLNKVMSDYEKSKRTKHDYNVMMNNSSRIKKIILTKILFCQFLEEQTTPPQEIPVAEKKDFHTKPNSDSDEIDIDKLSKEEKSLVSEEFEELWQARYDYENSDFSAYDNAVMTEDSTRIKNKIIAKISSYRKSKENQSNDA